MYNINITKSDPKIYIFPKILISFKKLKIFSGKISWNNMRSDLAVKWLSLISIKSEQVSKICSTVKRLSHPIHIGGSSPFNKKEWVIGFILDSKLSMKKHIIKICQTAYFELKRISSIRRFLTEDATKTLVTSYILSRLDYCNCLLMGTPNSVIQPLQKIQNFAARLVLLAPRHHHAAPLLEKLHWLPISERIKSLVCVSVL